MSVSDLKKAVADLIAFVEASVQRTDDQPLLDELLILDGVVYLEARKCGLNQSDMPRAPASNAINAKYFGRTNVLGIFPIRTDPKFSVFLEGFAPPSNPSKTLELVATPEWRAELELLCSLAEAQRATIELTPGGFILGGKFNSLAGRPFQILHAILEARHKAATVDQLRQALRINDESWAFHPEQVIKDAASDLRAALRTAAKKAKVACPPDPLPSTGKGAELSYRLALDS
jgi:hypothetical protein